LPISLLLSAPLPLFFFNVSFAYFWLAVRLFLDKNEIHRIPTEAVRKIIEAVTLFLKAVRVL
jgi:hypothetical protein